MKLSTIDRIGKLLVENNMPGWDFKILPEACFENKATIAHCFESFPMIVFNAGQKNICSLKGLEKVILHEMCHSVEYNHGKRFAKLAEELGGFSGSKITKKELKYLEY